MPRRPSRPRTRVRVDGGASAATTELGRGTSLKDSVEPCPVTLRPASQQGPKTSGGPCVPAHDVRNAGPQPQSHDNAVIPGNRIPSATLAANAGPNGRQVRFPGPSLKQTRCVSSPSLPDERRKSPVCLTLGNVGPPLVRLIRRTHEAPASGHFHHSPGHRELEWCASSGKLPRPPALSSPSSLGGAACLVLS